MYWYLSRTTLWGSGCLVPTILCDLPYQDPSFTPTLHTTTTLRRENAPFSPLPRRPHPTGNVSRPILAPSLASGPDGKCCWQFRSFRCTLPVHTPRPPRSDPAADAYLSGLPSHSPGRTTGTGGLYPGLGVVCTSACLIIRSAVWPIFCLARISNPNTAAESDEAVGGWPPALSPANARLMPLNGITGICPGWVKSQKDGRSFPLPMASNCCLSLLVPLHPGLSLSQICEYVILTAHSLLHFNFFISLFMPEVSILQSLLLLFHQNRNPLTDTLVSKRLQSLHISHLVA